MLLRGQYKLIVADPYRGAVPGIPLYQVTQEIERAGAPSSVLILWAGLGGSALLDRSALGVVSAAGYEAQVIHTWERVGPEGHGLPEVTPAGLATTELFIIATKGSPDLSRLAMPPHLNSAHVWRAPANPKHKPAGFFDWVDEQFEGPCLALYSNPLRYSWDAIGLREE